eukprot:15200594-Alexandrium_andersonii.AAC.1
MLQSAFDKLGAKRTEPPRGTPDDLVKPAGPVSLELIPASVTATATGEGAGAAPKAATAPQPPASIFEPAAISEPVPAE